MAQINTQNMDLQETEFDPVAYINEPRWTQSRLGLDRISKLLALLGNPEKTLKFVHVAGTNGKGSTCAFLASILCQAAYKTGLFTSPYIVEFSDRIQIDGIQISDDALKMITLEVKEAADTMEDHPTEFELMTAVAFQYFAQQECDIVVCEVGMGGRLDSTNVIEVPEVSVITSIALDHTAILGNTLTEIAVEKAGIIKRGIPVVAWPQKAEAQKVIELKVAENASSLSIPDFSVLTIHPPKDQSRIVRSFDYRNYSNIEISLMGSYQPYNASLVIEVVEVMRDRGWKIEEEALREGFLRTQWPARFEIIKGDPTFVIDGAHNDEGARALAESLHEVFPGQKPVFILGFLGDKDYPAMLETILPLGGAFVTITPPNPRALSAQSLASAIQETGHDLAESDVCSKPFVASNIPSAIQQAKKLAGPNGLVIAAGSLYSVAEIKKALKSAD